MNHVNSSFLSVYHTPFLTPELSSISSNTHSNQVPSKHIPLFWSNACVCSSGHEQLLCLNFFFLYGLSWEPTADLIFTSHKNTCCFFLHHAMSGLPSPDFFSNRSFLSLLHFSVSLFSLIFIHYNSPFSSFSSSPSLLLFWDHLSFSGHNFEPHLPASAACL